MWQPDRWLTFYCTVIALGILACVNGEFFRLPSYNPARALVLQSVTCGPSGLVLLLTRGKGHSCMTWIVGLATVALLLEAHGTLDLWRQPELQISCPFTFLLSHVVLITSIAAGIHTLASTILSLLSLLMESCGGDSELQKDDPPLPTICSALDVNHP